jgi:hypothetical protein
VKEVCEQRLMNHGQRFPKPLVGGSTPPGAPTLASPSPATPSSKSNSANNGLPVFQPFPTWRGGAYV